MDSLESILLLAFGVVARSLLDELADEVGFIGADFRCNGLVPALGVAALFNDVGVAYAENTAELRGDVIRALAVFVYLVG